MVNKQSQSKMKKIYQSEKGRSIVEMLAVIAIIGVITVGGSNLIGKSLNYTKANAIVSEAKTQLSAMDRRDVHHNAEKAHYVLKGFAGADGKVYIYDMYPVELDTKTNNNLILKISGISGGVCQLLKHRTDTIMMINDKTQENATCQEENNVVQFKLILSK